MARGSPSGTIAAHEQRQAIRSNRENAGYLLHLEFVAGHDSAQLPPKVHVRNALLGYRHGLPVESAVILLKPEADSKELTGKYTQTLPHRQAPYDTFEYLVRRVWTLDPEMLLAGGIGTLALAPISNVPEDQVPGIIRRMEERLSKKISRRRSLEVWDATLILLGLRYSNAVARQLLQGVRGMKESTTYQAILEEGEARGLRRAIVSQGSPSFGTPGADVQAALDAITDAERLLELGDRLKTATSWHDLLGIEPPAPRRRTRRSS